MKIKNEDGTETEVMTQEEVDAKLATEKATIEASHQTAMSEKDAAITAAATEKANLQKKIDDMVASGMNADNPSFKVLKEAMTKKDEELGNLKKEIDTDRATRKQEAMDAEIKIAARGNEEFAKKIKLNLEKTLAALPDGTVEERKIKLDAAIKLSTDASTQGMFDQGTGGGGPGNKYGEESGSGATVEFTQREKLLGNKLGITDEDRKKYGPKLVK